MREKKQLRKFAWQENFQKDVVGDRKVHFGLSNLKESTLGTEGG